jgi:hypothetical protein
MRLGAVTLIELLWVIAIIMVLIGLLLGPVSRALHRAKRVVEIHPSHQELPIWSLEEIIGLLK